MDLMFKEMKVNSSMRYDSHITVLPEKAIKEILEEVSNISINNPDFALTVKYNDKSYWLLKKEVLSLKLTVDENYWEKEHARCVSSPYYFYINYVKIDGETPTTLLSEEEFNKVYNEIKNQPLIGKRRNGKN